MASQRKQHFVPQCYMKPWQAPDDSGRERSSPSVWVFDRDGSGARRKAPSNLFTETDIYTVHLPDGRRDLYLEHGFGQLEDRFTRIRNLKLGRREWPDEEQLAALLAFVATAQARTEAQRDFHREQWGGLRRRLEEMEEGMKNWTLEEREAQLGRVVGVPDGPGLTKEDLREMEERPVQWLMRPVLQAVLPMMFRMNVSVLCTDDAIGFVTTDKPCTWFDPEAYKYPPMYRAPGLAMPSIEVTLPISPKQCLLITHRRDHHARFFDVDRVLVDQLNQRHIAHCDQHFISCSPETRPAWFERRPLPDDAWEKVQKKNVGQAAS